MPSGLLIAFFRATNSLGFIFLSSVVWQGVMASPPPLPTRSEYPDITQCPPNITYLNYAITGTESKDTITGYNADDTLKGLGADDLLNGCAGDDRLEGGEGNNSLSGGEGSDHFIFNTKPSQNKTDTIVDFDVEKDKIVLDRKFFPDLPVVADNPTQLQGSAFALSSTDIKPDQRFLFNPFNKTLYFDRDGSAGEKPIPIAVLKGVDSLNESSFLLEGNPALSAVDKFGSAIKQNSSTLLLVFLTATSLTSLLIILRLQRFLQTELGRIVQTASRPPRHFESQPSRQDQSFEPSSISLLSKQDIIRIDSDIHRILQMLNRQNQVMISKKVDIPSSKATQSATSPSHPKPPPPLELPGEALTSLSHPSASGISDPSAEIAIIYQSCFQRLDRLTLRNAATSELNITPASEEALCRGTNNSATHLEVVKGGGSYLLIERDRRYWLVPTFQTLNSFLTSQPSKGLFSYERGASKTSELRRPAEVRQVEATWEVISMGVVSVPS